MSDFNQAKYIQDYMKNNYDRIVVQVPKGRREQIKEHAKEAGYSSLNAYIIDIINRDMGYVPEEKEE